MELRHLRYFVAAAEAENVSRAAGRLHVSQPALSRQIRDLEEELGFSLFERSAKSVRLTAAGKTFAIEARAVLERAEEAVNRARVLANGERAEIHISLFESINAKPSIAEEHDSSASLIAAIESGAGVAFVLRSFSCSAGPRLKLIPLSPAPPTLVIGAVWPKDGLTPVAERFWESAQKAVSAMK
jgi:DNA-binding transcriptional LysR family regulator